MPVYRLVTQHEAVFTPDEVTIITGAFEDALQRLGIRDRADPMAEILAKRVIELAKAGERDRMRLRESALSTFEPKQKGK